MHDISIEQRTTYLRGLLQGYGTLSLPLGSGLSFSLHQIFQPLRLRQSVAHEEKQHKDKNEEIQRDRHEDSRKKDETEDQERALDVLAENGVEALNKSERGRIVILGGPGTGKTTVLKHLLYHHAQQALEELSAPLPIFLSLPELARAGQDLDTALAQLAQQMGLEADYGRTLAHAIEQGHAFVCLDSLDEVLPRQRAGIIRQINELAQRAGNVWIVGSRFTDYKGGQFQQGQFQEWELQPLDHERRLKLARQLLPELQRQLVPSVSSTHDPDPYAYVQALSEHRQAATWGTNPLLFSLGAVAYLRRGSLSGSRAMLYREVIDALLETRGGDVQLRHILAQIALDLYQIKGRTFTFEDLHAILTEINTTQQATWSVEEMRYRVLNSGILDVVAAETYSFRHQTFQEYLVASALAHRFMSADEQTRTTAQQLAWSKHTYSRWNQIERLLVGILVQEYGEAGTVEARTWFTRLLEQRNNADGDPGNLSLELAINVLGEVAQLEEWQAAETLELEEMAATVWGEEVKRLSGGTLKSSRSKQYGRYLVMAADIGCLRPAAQQKTIESFLNVLVEGRNYLFSKMLGALHSSFLTQYLLAALERYPDPYDQQLIGSIFAYMGEFAPIDFLLDELNSEEHKNDYVGRSLMHLIPYVPAEKLVPVLRMRRFGRSQTAANILTAMAKSKELPIDDLLKLLYEEQEEAAFYAACVLAEVQHPAAIDLLLAHAHLGDPQPDVRLDEIQLKICLRALRALRQYTALLPLDRIVAMLGDRNTILRRTVVEYLACLGAAAPLEPLVQAARDADGMVRQQAIRALGQLGDQAPLDVLIQATSDSLFWVAKTAIEALGMLGHRTPLEVLFALLDKRNLVAPTLEVLGKKQMIGLVPTQLLLDLYERNWQERGEILKTLANMRHPLANVFLVNILSDEYIYNEYIYGAGFVSVVDWCLEQGAGSFLSTEQRDVIGERCYPVYNRAIAILGCWQERQALDVLMQALADERWRVSDAAASILCKRANEPTQADMLALLKHRHAWVRKNVLQVIAERTNPFPVEPLMVALHDSDDKMRAAAAKALRVHGEGASLDELFAATRDNSLEVCREAVFTLSKLGRRDPALVVAGVMDLLRHETSDGDYPVYDGAEVIHNAFDELSSSVSAEILLQALYDSDKIEVASFVATALGKMGEGMPIEELAHALQDQNEHIQQASASALAMSGKRAPVAALIEALNTKNSDYVHQEVIAALAKVSKYGSVPDEIFVQKIFKQGDYDTYEPLFQAFEAQGKRISEEIVLDALEHFPHSHRPAVLHYLDQFAELLPALPEKSVAMALAMYAAHENHYRKPETAGMIRRLLSKLSANSLLEIVTHRKRDVRIGVLCLLAEYPEAIQLDPILPVLHDPDPAVRRGAIECLYKRPENLPVEAIIACLQDTNIWVCTKVISVLGSLGAQAPLSDLMTLLDSPSPEIRSAAIHALAQPGLFERVPTEVFIHALGEHDNEGRQVALKVLAAKDPHIAIEHCIAALGDSDENQDLARVAFQLLEQIHPAIIPEIIQEATALFQDGKPGRFFRTLSVGFLADIIGNIYLARPDLIAQLGEWLDWPYWEVRMKATRALGELRRNIPDAIIRRLLDLRHDPHSRAVREAADTALAEILSLETGIEDD